MTKPMSSKAESDWYADVPHLLSDRDLFIDAAIYGSAATIMFMWKHRAWLQDCKETVNAAVVEAVTWGNTSVLRALYGSGVSLDVTPDKGWYGGNALHWCVWRQGSRDLADGVGRHATMLLYLLDTDVNLFKRDQSGQTPYQFAVANKNKSVADVLYEAMRQTAEPRDDYPLHGGPGPEADARGNRGF